ncbi:translation initiation factor IF-2-like [Camelus ferus]|uniref:Translation initiation factor IF-2-like n=1 Tax=Camelus ferus TaxID=419612 RepID=A0A8B8S0L5_CAMFR|nr:translation initiation factor IF-2-like [Camelus ferus]
MWALCLCPQAKGEEETAGTELGATPPRLPRAPPQAASDPAPRAAPGGQPHLPSSLSCPHPGHRPSSSAVSAPRSGALLGRMGHDAASSSGMPVAGEPRPDPASPVRRASLSRPGLTCLVAQLSWVRPLQPDCRCLESCAGCAGGASPEPRPGPKPSAARAVLAPECARSRGLTEVAGLERERDFSTAPPPRAPLPLGTAPSPRAEGGLVGKETLLGERA